jgi:hypothetical protein
MPETKPTSPQTFFRVVLSLQVRFEELCNFLLHKSFHERKRQIESKSSQLGNSENLQLSIH